MEPFIYVHIVHIRQLIRLGHRKAYVEYFILFLSVSASTPCCCLHPMKMSVLAWSVMFLGWNKGRKEQTFGFVAHSGRGPLCHYS